MLRLAAIALTVCCGCSGQRKADSLVGTYVAWAFIEGQAVGYDGSSGSSQKLTLKPGGTYTFSTETSVMMRMSLKAEGTYSLVGDELTFLGTMTSTIDDGYKKGTETSPHQLKLRVANGMLQLQNGTTDIFYFRKEGTGPPPLPPELVLKDSAATALDLVKKVEESYSTVQSMRVTGTVKSQGGGFVAQEARFKLLFRRPSQFRFEALVLKGSLGDSHKTEITWDGGAKCWWYTPEFGEVTDRTLGNALSIVAVNVGPQADILPRLLLSNTFRSGDLRAQYPEATLLADETIGGRDCSVLQLKSRGADRTKLWVEKSSGMILRLHEDLRDVTVAFDPHPNEVIDPKEFSLGKRAMK